MHKFAFFTREKGAFSDNAHVKSLDLKEYLCYNIEKTEVRL